MAADSFHSDTNPGTQVWGYVASTLTMTGTSEHELNVRQGSFRRGDIRGNSKNLLGPKCSHFFEEGFRRCWTRISITTKITSFRGTELVKLWRNNLAVQIIVVIRVG